jgi:DNA polymerase
MIHDYSAQSPVFFDFETQSPVELKKTGGLIYSLSPDTRVLSLSCLLDRKLIVWLPLMVGKSLPEINLPEKYQPLYDELLLYATETLPVEIEQAVRQERTFVAHNMAHFDYHIWANCVTARGYGSLPSRWGDTLFLARIAGLPVGGLDTIAQQMLGVEKDSAKRIVMPLTRAEYIGGECKYPPVLAGQVEPLVRYCSVDTLILPLLWEKFTDVRVEQDVIQEHQNINERGIAVDLSLAARISEVSAYASEQAGLEIERLTKGEIHGERPDHPDKKERKSNLRSTQQMHAWLEKNGVRITDHTGMKLTLRKEAVEKCLANPLLMLSRENEYTINATRNTDSIPPEVFSVLRLRSVANRITSAKTDRMGDRRSSDGRIRDLFTYHKAHTGRWSSSGVQIHNLPRGRKGIPIADLLSIYESGKWPNDTAEAYRLVESLLPVEKDGTRKLNVDDALSALIRPCFTAGEKNKLCIVDYAAIECRGVAWLAGEQKLLDQYLRGEDVYCNMARILYGREIDPKKDKDERQLGKIVILACGYGMGPEKFAITCGLYGIDLRKLGLTAERCVDTYRAAYPAIAGTYAGSINGRAYRRGGFWDQLNIAAMNAVNYGGMYRVGRIAYYYHNRNLHCILPSGRELRYFNCRMEDRVPGYVVAMNLERKTKPTLVYESQYGSEAVLYGGKLAENVTQASMRDVLACATVRGAYRLSAPFTTKPYTNVTSRWRKRTYTAWRRVCLSRSTGAKDCRLV